MKDENGWQLSDIGMSVLNCAKEDLGTILNLYDAARKLQQSRMMVEWPHFSDEFLLSEIAEKRQWKLMIDQELVCNWATTYEDKDIWGERERGDAIYIHRIATHPDFRGNNFVRKIVEWAKIFAGETGRKFIRLDTLGNNEKLIDYYQKSGFNFLGMVRIANTENLPDHYQKEPDCNLFEISI